MIAAKRAELLAARANLPKGEILKRPSDLLGAIVAGQLDVEAEAGTDSKGKHNAGLSPDEVLGNACEWRKCLPKSAYVQSSSWCK